MPDPTELVACWLLPAPEFGSVFEELIRGLARRFDAPIFEPHLTLCVAPPEDSLGRKAPEDVTRPPFIELKVEGIEYSEKFTKTLFVQFKKTAQLAALAEAMQEGSSRDLNPHLSLIYQTLPTATKAELVGEIQLPFARVRFDALKTIRTAARIESAAEVEAWRSLWECPLAHE